MGSVDAANMLWMLRGLKEPEVFSRTAGFTVRQESWAWLISSIHVAREFFFSFQWEKSYYKTKIDSETQGQV